MRVLTKLRIDEVSSVDRGAGEGARVLLMKRDQGEKAMSRTEQLQSMVKDFGIVKIAKFIVTEGTNATLSEAEFTKLVHDYAQADRKQGETPQQAFTRTFTADTDEGWTLRKAHAVVKSFPQVMSVEPTQVGGEAALNVNDPTDAYDQLVALAEKQRALAPSMTIEQAFARVYAENPGLAARERLQNRP